MAAPSVNTSGSQTATINTQHDLATITTAGYYQLQVDTANMVNGDTLKVIVSGKVRSGDTERIMEEYTISHAQSAPNIFTPMYCNVHDIKFSIKQTAGTGRAFPWAVYQGS